jgi:adenylate kinase
LKNLVFIGPPGSGKDTQIEELIKIENFNVVRAGNIAKNLTKTNKRFEQIVASGGLIDDDVILAEVDKLMHTFPIESGIIFDGFPRTLHQAEKLDQLLEHQNRYLDAVVYISLEEDEIIKRLSSRKICSLCGENILNSVEKCRKCGGRPVRRHDDEPAIIIDRVQTFLEKTLPLVDYFRNKAKLIEIDGDQTIGNVSRDIREKLGYV